MKALLIKDFLNIKAQGKAILLVLAVWFIISVINGSGSFFAALSVVYAILLPLTSVTADDKCGFERYAMTMPLTRTVMALSKYVFALACSLVMAAIGFAACVVIDRSAINEALATCAACFCVAVVLVSLLLPLVYKYGPDKARLVMMAVFVVGFLVFGFVLDKLDVELELNAIFIAMPVIALVLLAASAAVSVCIYKKKEF